MCAIVATRTDVELRDMFNRLDQYDVGFFQNSRAVELVHHLINKGSLQDISYMVGGGVGVAGLASHSLGQ